MQVEWRYEDANNFSYDVIARAIRIPVNQQMIVFQQLELNNTLTLNGTLVLIN